jgi:hypothetical protein
MNDDVALFHLLSETRKHEMDALMRAFTKHVAESAQAEWQAEIDRQPISMRQLAVEQAATARQYPKQNLQAVADRLRRKAIKQSLTTKDMADIEGLLLGGSPRAQLIEELVAGLRRLGIKIATYR